MEHEPITPYIWVTDFDEQDVINFYNHFMHLEADPGVEKIVVYIHSYGGSVYGYLSMRDLIKRSTKEVVTVVIGKAMSAGAMLAVAGHTRYAAAQARYLIHQVSSGAEGTGTEIKVRADEISELNRILLKNLAEDTGKTIAFWKKIYLDKNLDCNFSAEDALGMGVVDQITIPMVLTSMSTDIGIVKFEADPEPKQRKKRTKKK